ncbi:MAG: TonB-dependent receptor plug domain-containing protein, partial [Bacteroidaceae bacterium]|nr:TonB-dependent receptor plug domain-containing protein [Bacteroidaceae bacterium]
MFLASLLLCVGAALAQVQVKGTVISADDGEPLPGVSVKIVGDKAGTVTNIDGDFVITVPNADARLQFSHIGMITRVVKARSGMRISLDSDESLMNEVLVQGFGTATKASFTGSAKVITSEDLAKSQVTSVTDALAGVVPGLQTVSSNGAPGATATIRVRGFSSLNASNDPLIIVDGAPYNGDIANLNPSDIESMTVTKDAAANALYGARGSNGVIQIVTKRAKAGDAKVTFDAKVGWNSRALQHYNTIKSPGQYYEMQYEALKNYYIDNGSNATEAWQRANANLFGDSGNGGLGYNVFSYPESQVLIGQNGKLNPNATLGRLITNGDGVEFWVTPDDWEEI